MILNFGHQWVFGERFLVDSYFGLGYAFDNRGSNYYNDYAPSGDSHFVILKTGPGANVGFSGGLRVGWLIK